MKFVEINKISTRLLEIVGTELKSEISMFFSNKRPTIEITSIERADFFQKKDPLNNLHNIVCVYGSGILQGKLSPNSLIAVPPSTAISKVAKMEYSAGEDLTLGTDFINFKSDVMFSKDDEKSSSYTITIRIDFGCFYKLPGVSEDEEIEMKLKDEEPLVTESEPPFVNKLK